MSNTGVRIDDNCIQAFNDFKMKSSYRYIFFKVSDDKKSIVVDATGDPSETYSDFLRRLPKEDCRYAVFMFEYTTESDGKRMKIIFFNWAPDAAPTRFKMLYAGTKNDVRKALVGVNVEIQGTDMAEVDEAEVLARCAAVSK